MVVCSPSWPVSPGSRSTTGGPRPTTWPPRWCEEFGEPPEGQRPSRSPSRHCARSPATARGARRGLNGIHRARWPGDHAGALRGGAAGARAGRPGGARPRRPRPLHQGSRRGGAGAAGRPDLGGRRRPRRPRPSRRPRGGPAELGWVDEHPYTSPTVLPMHSLTFRHPKWPCELDLHDRFPGFFADPQAVFERLWARRTTVSVAGRRGARAGPGGPRVGPGSALAARPPRRLAPYRARGPRAAPGRGPRGGAAPRPGRAGRLPRGRRHGRPVPARGRRPADRGRVTRRRRPAGLAPAHRAPDATAVSWVAELRRLPLRAWPRYLWYAAWLSDHELRMADPELPDSRQALTRARWRRLRRGLAALPDALRSVVRRD